MTKALLPSILAVLSIGCVAHNLPSQSDEPSRADQLDSRGGNSEGTTRKVASVVPPLILVPPHVAIPNPGITPAFVEERMKNFLKLSNVTTFTVESKPVQWAKDTLGYSNPIYIAPSNIWAVTIKGTIQWPVAMGSSGYIPTGTTFLGAVDVENGDLIACNLLK